ncbi:MAG: hypothetical protein JWM11_2321 [Planctomycetaceae bacterium]|nr:hypothetical protein [Planctomycetaceae bacterium]
MRRLIAGRVIANDSFAAANRTNRIYRHLNAEVPVNLLLDNAVNGDSLLMLPAPRRTGHPMGFDTVRSEDGS